MKTDGQLQRWLFMATFCCALYVVRASEEELLDFDFSDLKEIDWNYNDNDNSRPAYNKDTTTSQENLITFDDDLELEEENQVHPFDWREKMLRTALSKAMTNKAVRQKFIEVMPILRVLSKQQRLALSALITAQISAKKGHELKLEQVRMMFGDDKNLILPIVYDIANLVRNSAKKYIEFDYSIADLVNFPKTKVSYARRTLDLTPKEVAEEEANEGVGTIPLTAKMTQEDELEDFMSGDEVIVPTGAYLDPMEINTELGEIKSENLSIPVALEGSKSTEAVPVADPLVINHELQKDVPTMELLKAKITEDLDMPLTPIHVAKVVTSSSTTSATKSPLRRTRRSTENSEFVHKLIRAIPASVNEADLQRGMAGRTLKLNTTAFATPKETTMAPAPATPSAVVEENVKSDAANLDAYQLVENFAFASLNGTEITLDEGDDATKEEEDEAEGNDNKNDGNDSGDGKDELLPTPEELISGPRYRLAGSKIVAKRISASASSKRKRVKAPPPPPPSRPLGSGVPPPTKCERFTASMCIKTEDYPM